MLIICSFADFPSTTCNEVTGHVGKNLTLNCTVIYSDRCKAVLYKFINKDKDKTICRVELTSKSKQQHFSCSYTPNEDMTATFLFFLQANCGTVFIDFKVNTAGTVQLTVYNTEFCWIYSHCVYDNVVIFQICWQVEEMELGKTLQKKLQA